MISWTNYNEWGEITHNAVLKCGARELDLVKEYATHDYDAVLNQYYAKARFYDADNRRFISADPVLDPSEYDISAYSAQPVQLMQYLYVANSPVVFIDPLGLEVAKVSLNGSYLEAIADTEDIDSVVNMLNLYTNAYRDDNVILVYDYASQDMVSLSLSANSSIADIFKRTGLGAGSTRAGAGGYFSPLVCGDYRVSMAAYGSQAYLGMINSIIVGDNEYEELSNVIRSHRIMRDVNNAIGWESFARTNEDDFMDLAVYYAGIISAKGFVNEEEHFFRNRFTVEPEWETLIKNDSKVSWENIENWTELPYEKSVLHQYGYREKSGTPHNRKFVSNFNGEKYDPRDGLFEIVFSWDDTKNTWVLQTEKNAPDNMGTFNYADPNTNPANHVKLDVDPWYEPGNTTKDSMHMYSRMGRSIYGAILIGSNKVLQIPDDIRDSISNEISKVIKSYESTVQIR